jgi:hypothetical protein
VSLGANIGLLSLQKVLVPTARCRSQSYNEDVRIEKKNPVLLDDAMQRRC